MNWPDGSLFDVHSYTQDTRLHESDDIDWLWNDEPPPEDKWIAGRRGLVDRNGTNIMTYTLLSEPWIVEKLYDKWLEGDSEIDFFFSSMDDNPYNSKEGIEEFCRHLDPAELSVRRYGRFIHLEGRIIPSFDSKVHVIKLEGPQSIPKNWTRYCVMDPHDSRPTFIAWAAVSPPDPIKSYIVWYRMWILANMTITKIAERILYEERKSQERIYRRIIDPNFGSKKSANTRLTIKQEYFHAGIQSPSFEDANDDLPLGHAKIREMLFYDRTRPIDPSNCPSMYFADYLQAMIMAMRLYSWSRDKNDRIVLVNDAKPDPKYKDPVDLVRYLSMANPRFVDDAGNIPERKVLSLAGRIGRRHQYIVNG